MTARTAPTLRERVTEPGLQRAVERQRARLDAEEAGWAVMEPGVAQALLAVERVARRAMRTEQRMGGVSMDEDPRSYQRDDVAIWRALRRLDRTRAPRGDGKRRGHR